MARQSSSEKSPSSPDEPPSQTGTSYARARASGASYQTVGLDLVVSVLVGLFGGRWLDGKLGTNGLLTMIGFGFGVAAGFRFIYRAAVKMRRETEAEDERERRSKREIGASPDDPS